MRRAKARPLASGAIEIRRVAAAAVSACAPNHRKCANPARAGQTPGAHTLRFLKSPPTSAPPTPHVVPDPASGGQTPVSSLAAKGEWGGQAIWGRIPISPQGVVTDNPAVTKLGSDPEWPDDTHSTHTIQPATNKLGSDPHWPPSFSGYDRQVTTEPTACPCPGTKSSRAPWPAAENGSTPTVYLADSDEFDAPRHAPGHLTESREALGIGLAAGRKVGLRPRSAACRIQAPPRASGLPSHRPNNSRTNSKQ